MLFEVLSHLFALDFGWFVPFILNNLIWVFFLACLAHFIYGKGPLLGTAFVAIYLYATFDFTQALGWVFQSGFFWAPLVGFFCLTAYDAFFPKGINFLKRPLFAGVVFYCALFLINTLGV